jgi:peptide chain release factor 1
MKPRIAEKLEQLSTRLADLDAALADPGVTADIDHYRKLTREHAELTPVIALYQAWCRARDDGEAARGLLTDADMKELAQLEIEQSAADMQRLEGELQRALLPKDPDDGRNVFLEIRAGTGGDESALFAADLFRMYSRYAERNRWKVEVVSASESDLGGYREIIARVSGDGVYQRLKFESGGHRVQRVPVTETQGRIHTSACTVAVMAEVDEVAEIDINPADLRIDTFRASGAGGQHINKTDSAVRITHIPTGIVVECQDDRSQHRNKAQAMSVLAARIRDAQVRARDSQIASTRKSLVGSGDRSERIRTYNFPQGRMTDHRINLTLYKLDAIMDGDLTELMDALAHEHQAEQLAQLAEEGA